MVNANFVNLVKNGNFTNGAAEKLGISTWAYAVSESWSISNHKASVIVNKYDTVWGGIRPLQGDFLQLLQGDKNSENYIYQRICFQSTGLYELSLEASSRPYFGKVRFRVTVTMDGDVYPTGTIDTFDRSLHGHQAIDLDYNLTSYSTTFRVAAGNATLHIINTASSHGRMLIIDAVRIVKCINLVKNGDFDDGSVDKLGGSTWVNDIPESWSGISKDTSIMISANNTAWGGLQPVAGQILLGLQHTGSYIYQEVSFPFSGLYQLSLWACSRPGHDQVNLRATVKTLDGRILVTITNDAISYEPVYYSMNFTTFDTVGTLEIMNVAPPGDRTLLVDAVRIYFLPRSKYLDVLQNKAHGLHLPNELRHVQTFDSHECEHYESCNVDSKSIGELATIGRHFGTDKISHHGYHRFYPRFLNHLRSKTMSGGKGILEIGLDKSKSLLLWLSYFPAAFIYGIDNSLVDFYIAGNRFKLFKVDQSKLGQLQFIVKEHLKHSIFLIIDDGSHVPEHQILSFNYLFTECLEAGGTYIIEDIETSYWQNGILYGYNFRYGYLHGNSAVEAFKKLADDVNYEFLAPEVRKLHELNIGSKFSSKTRAAVSSITFSMNCIIITKKTREEMELYDNHTYIHEELSMQGI